MLRESLEKYFNDKDLRRIDTIMYDVELKYLEKYTTVGKITKNDLLKKLNHDIDYIDKVELKDNIKFKEEVKDLKNRLKKGETLDDILVDAYALAMAASKKVNKFTHRDCQIKCGIALHKGDIAELATGEGKTLTATLPAFLHALGGEPVHIVTANEYLVQHDCEINKELFEELGMTTGVILNTDEQSNDDKRKNYKCDIVYSTATELGFDYLRDNESATKVANGYGFAIIDEADDILINEATTPLILSKIHKTVSFRGDTYLAQFLIDALSKQIDFDDSTATADDYADEDANAKYDIIQMDQERSAYLIDRGENRIREIFREIYNVCSLPNGASRNEYIKSSQYLSKYATWNDQHTLLDEALVNIIQQKDGVNS